jgi:hypothetical protein
MASGRQGAGCHTRKVKNRWGWRRLLALFGQLFGGSWPFGGGEYAGINYERQPQQRHLQPKTVFAPGVDHY